MMADISGGLHETQAAKVRESAMRLHRARIEVAAAEGELYRLRRDLKLPALFMVGCLRFEFHEDRADAIKIVDVPTL